MDQKFNITNTGLTLPGRQHYGRYGILLLLIPVILGIIKPFVPDSVFFEQIIGNFLTFAVLGSAYLLILWVLEIIRFRGGIERPQNHSARAYAKYLIIVAVLVGSLDRVSFDFLLAHQVLIPTLVILRGILGVGLIYLLVLWVIEIIRLRGGIERPINKIARKILSIACIALVIIYILGQWFFASFFGFTL